MGTDPESVALGDFLGNGRLDLAVVNKASNTVTIFLNNGSGTFTLDTTLTVGSAPTSATAGDLNKDGYADLVVANSGDNNISVFLSNGDGTFAVAVNYVVGTGPTAVVMADFSGDGKLDVAVANGGSNNVSVLIGNGDGTLGTATNYSVGTNPVALTVGSVDDNGIPDLTVGNHGSNNETVLGNIGHGDFVVYQTIPLGESPDSVAVADFANNGVLYYVTDAGILTGKDRQRYYQDISRARKGLLGAGVIPVVNPLLPKKEEYYFEDIGYEVGGDAKMTTISIHYNQIYGSQVNVDKLQTLLDEAWKTIGPAGYGQVLSAALAFAGENLRTHESLQIQRTIRIDLPPAQVTNEILYQKLGLPDLQRKLNGLAQIPKQTDKQKAEFNALLTQLEVMQRIYDRIKQKP